MSGLPDVELSTLRPEELVLAVGVAARGMRDNPMSVALFGDDPVRRERGLEPVFHWVLASQQLPTLVARRLGHIVGIATLAPPSTCFSRQMVEQQRTIGLGRARVGVSVPRVPRAILLSLLRLGPGGLARVSQLGEATLEHDPQQPHQHVELVAVEAALQGLGIGSLMLEALCRRMDELPDVAYLETDKPENVRFYQRFGFAVVEEATVIGTHFWYMQRERHARFTPSAAT